MNSTNEVLTVSANDMAELVREVRDLKALHTSLVEAFGVLNENLAGKLEAIAEDVSHVRRLAVRSAKVGDGTKAALVKLAAKTATTVTKVNKVISVLKDGEIATTPVDKLTPAKRRQFEAVMAYHREHPCSSLSNAIHQAYLPEKGGYTEPGLKSFLFRNRNFAF